MITAIFVLWMGLVVLTVRWFRSKVRFAAAQWCLWLGFWLAYAAFQFGWVPSDLITAPAIIVFFIYFFIQGMRIAAAARESKST
jgi:hypothetical protein